MRTSEPSALLVEPVAVRELACSFRGRSGLARLDKDSKIRLCDASGAHCYLESVESGLHEGESSLLVGATSPGVFVELSYDGLRIRGFAGSASEYYQFVTRPLVLGRVFVPTRVEVRAAAPGRVTIGAQPEFVLRAPEPLEAEVPCDDVSSNSPWWPPEEITGALGAEGTTSAATLPAGQVRFSVSATGPLDGVLTGSEPRVVQAHPVLRGRRRVIFDEEDGTFSAWVDARDLRPAPPPRPQSYGASAGGRYSFIGPSEDPGRVCARDVDVVAVVDRHVLGVGTTKAGKPISTRGPGLPGFVEIALRHRVIRNPEGQMRTDQRIAVAPGASLQVRWSDLEGCPLRKP